MRTTDLTAGSLRALRRLDWRFLLPHPTIGRIAVLASPLADEPDDALLAGLHQLADAVDLVSDGRHITARHDIVVARNPAPAALRDATRLLGDRGLAYVELHRARRAARIRGITAWQRALADGGLSAMSAHWHHPSFEAAEIVPFSPPSIRMALARRRGSRLRNLVASSAGTMPGAHVGLARAVPAVSLLAGRPRNQHTGSWLLRNRPTTDTARLTNVPWLLVTPRFATSRHVVLVVGPDLRGSVPWVAKTPRVATDTAALTHEAGILASLASRIGGSGTFPRLLSLDEGPPAVLVESALVGRPLDPLEVRRDPTRALTLGVEWVRKVAATASPAEAGHFATRIREALRRLADPPFALDPGALSRAQRILAVLDGSRVPAVIEHGDMSHPNLVMQHDGLGVIDWELGTIDGMPLADLAFFIGYLAFARSSAATPAAHAEALRAALAPLDGWGLRALREHSHELGLPGQLVAPLVLAAWTRYVASVGGRLVSEDAAASAQVARYSAAWHAVLDVTEALS